ncbi:hypothetical protein F4677DRAFT_447197 [Hypoxylon crocopeplum]|nr:hypothetical protein F4677DRAFT_447197 [Hypoxylon crocopeplum]
MPTSKGSSSRQSTSRSGSFKHHCDNPSKCRYCKDKARLEARLDASLCAYVECGNRLSHDNGRLCQHHHDLLLAARRQRRAKKVERKRTEPKPQPPEMLMQHQPEPLKQGNYTGQPKPQPTYTSAATSSYTSAEASSYSPEITLPLVPWEEEIVPEWVANYPTTSTLGDAALAPTPSSDNYSEFNLEPWFPNTSQENQNLDNEYFDSEYQALNYNGEENGNSAFYDYYEH